MELGKEVNSNLENINENNIEINNNNEITNNLVTEEKQRNFLDSALGNAINNGIDIGIRLLLPDLVENQIINLKDNLLKYGISEGINKSINSAIDMGKDALGILTGNFENISQVQNVIKSGGILDNVSELIDFTLNKVTKAGVIDNSISKLIKKGKDVIISNVEKNIENTFSNQMESLEFLGKYMNNWNEYYNNRDFDGMEKEYNKIKKELKELMPLEETIAKARKIENLHTLIKNNGKNFNISEEALQLAEKL